ncbi:hypothetical protein PVAND_011950 [Polypedilum vanderplanki]|uniref:Peptidase S1 domain-containing protein n=1 Tax=Polypedilum vanderplanki TaxID=319348 RepID=A0A9J6CL76_POLVA|nr:hypothetical protein PVAND_011950 [Polypedilum vanderplanki]
MFRLLIVSTLIACALSAVVPDATETEEFRQWSGRIVGGQTAAPGQFPYQTSMRSAANAHFCGGFIINHRTVSWGVPCGTASPDMFARISAVATWLDANTVN